MLPGAGYPVVTPCMQDGANPLISFSCTLHLLGQILLLNKSRNYSSRKNELVHLCAPQEEGIQAFPPASYTFYLMAPPSTGRVGAWAAAGRHGNQVWVSQMLPLHCFMQKHSCHCQPVIKGIKKQACSAFEAGRLASKLRGGGAVSCTS